MLAGQWRSPEAAHIQHRVSKRDTLAGIAIKYGVEVADIKRLNGLVTDLQMFAHNILKIPLSGSHSPSTAFFELEIASTSGSQPSQKTMVKSESRCREKRPLSSAINLLRGYYGLSSLAKQPCGDDGEKETSIESESCHYGDDGGFFPESKSTLVLRHHDGVLANEVQNKNLIAREAKGISRSGNDCVIRELGDVDKAVRRRSKVEIVNPTVGSYDIGDRRILDSKLPSLGFSSAQGISADRPTRLLKVFDGALPGVKATGDVTSSSTTAHDQISFPGGYRYGSKFDVQPANLMTSRSLFDGLTNPLDHRFKVAID